MNWGLEDVFAAMLLIGAAILTIIAIQQLVQRRPLRFLFIAIVMLTVLAIWAHLAVGIFERLA
jgi:hypothetical protein